MGDVKGQLESKCVVLEESYDVREFYFELENITSEDVFLKDFTMFTTKSLETLGVDPTDCLVFRSGRHKNDMPAVFRLGVKDEAMLDAMGGMTETGDKQEVADGESCILSDHLTVLGNEQGYVVISFPDGRDQMMETAIYVDDQGKFKRLTSKVLFGIRVAPGQKLATERIRIEFTKDVTGTIDAFVQTKAKRYGARNQAHPSVFCTWYYYGLTVTYEDVKVNLQQMQKRALPFDVFQVDEGWEITLGEWEPNHKFPVDMKDLAKEIQDAGYRPGIWTSPFVAHATASIWEKHPEWILRDAKGEPCLFPMNDTVYQVFDITNPATWEYFYELYRKLTFDWGYTYHKLDFTRAAVIMDQAVYFDDTITLTQAYRKAVEAIRRGMGEKSYFLMCGGLYDPIIGLVDAQRTGSDVLSMWSSTINKGGKTAPYTTKQSILRYYMNAWWNNDPDALMIRRNEQMERNLRLTYGLLNDEEVKTSVINQYMGGGLVCSTEPLDKMDEDRLENLKKIIPVVPTTVQPLRLMNCEVRYPEMVKVTPKGSSMTTIARINWSDTEDMPIEFVLDEKLLPEGANNEAGYVVCDYYGKCYRTDVKVGDKVVLSTLKPHGATVVKIQPMGNVPVIVESDGHFSMGAEGIELAMEDSCLHVKYENLFGYELTYQVLLPAGYEALDGKKTIEVKVAPFEKLDRKWGCKYAV